MGKATEYLKGKEAQKQRVLKYLIKRRDYIINMIKKRWKDTREINSSELEVFLTYNATISDIKKDELD